MEMQLILSIIFFSLNLAAKEKIETPSYQILLNAQFACSNKPIEPYKFVRRDPNEPFNEVAPKVWGVIKNIKLTELTHSNLSNDGEKNFKLEYTKMGLFRCGKEVQELSQKGVFLETLPVVYPAHKKEGFFDTSNDDPREKQENINIVRYTKIRDGDNDGPPVPGRVGLPCLVMLDDALKNNNAINIDVLCKGESKKAREFTKKEIRRAIELWKKK